MNKQELFAAFNNLSVADKRKELGRELSETMLLIYQYIKEINQIDGEIDLNDFLNLYNGNLTEDEYLNGYYEDFINFKELLGIYINKLSDNENNI